MDDGDGVEGFLAEKSGVAGRKAGDLTGGVPFRVSGSAQATKEQVSITKSYTRHIHLCIYIIYVIYGMFIHVYAHTTPFDAPSPVNNRC